MWDQGLERLPRLSDIPLFAELSAECLESLDSKADWFRPEPGTLIIDGSDDRSHPVYILVHGNVTVLRDHGTNGLVPVTELRAVTSFGEFAAINGKTGPASIRTCTDCLIGELPADGYLEAMLANPRFMLSVLQRTVARIQDLDRKFTDLAGRDKFVDELYKKLLRLTA